MSHSTKHRFKTPAVQAAQERSISTNGNNLVYVEPAEFRAADSVILNRRQFARDVGVTFGGNRDIYEALGYERNLIYYHYKRRYERGGIASRIIEAAPRATWSGGAKIVEDPDPEVDTPFESDIAKMLRRVNAWQKFLRSDILAGVGRYSVLLIGAPGKPQDPLPKDIRPDQILYLTAVPEDKATFHDYVSDPANPRHNLPEFYHLTLSDRFSHRVHWTRIIHVSENAFEDGIMGIPRLRPVWNYLDDLDKLVGGGSEAAWKRMDPGMQVDLDPSVRMSASEQVKLSDEIDEYRHNFRRVLRTRGAKINELASPVFGFGPNVHTVLELIAGTINIPLRILIGSESGELASSQDTHHWNEVVSARRKDHAEPLIREFISRIAPDVEDYKIEWPFIDELDENTKASVVAKLAEANAAQRRAGDSVIFTSNEIRGVVGKESIDVDQLPEGTRAGDPLNSGVATEAQQRNPSGNPVSEKTTSQVPVNDQHGGRIPDPE